MLSKEQVEHFQAQLVKAKKIIIGNPRHEERKADIHYHIRVSGRQTPTGVWCVGFIFGIKGHSEWLKIAEVAEAELVKAKQIYRAMLKDLIATK